MNNLTMNNFYDQSVEFKISLEEESQVEYDKANLDLRDASIKELRFYTSGNDSECVVLKNVTIKYTGRLEVSTRCLNTDFYNSIVFNDGTRYKIVEIGEFAKTQYSSTAERKVYGTYERTYFDYCLANIVHKQSALGGEITFIFEEG